MIAKASSAFRSWFQRQQTCPTCRLNILRTPITATQPPQQQAVIINNNNNARPNEPAAAPQQNPFLNLLNQTGLGNQQPAASTSTTSIPTPQAFNAPGAQMPPPFFFPSMPFMAPYTIPPPPMPQNLDQLTVEELRAMEGNERKHVEERLKLLRNVQTMLNASTALMNQYQMVVANLPPVPIQPQPPVASTSAAAAPATTEQAAKPEEKPSEAETGQVKIEDIGSEEHLSNKSSPLSSQPSSSSKLPTIDSPSATSSSFIASESSATNGESEEANEIRKRRLQKFLQSD